MRGILLRPLAQPLGRAVGRRVVEDHEFKVGKSLPEDALDRLVEVRKRVVDRHHDAEAGFEVIRAT